MSTTDEQRLRDAVIKFLKDHDPEGFGCACQPDGSKCGPCTWNERFNPLRAALAAKGR